MEAIYGARELAVYINSRHNATFGKDISGIKLQKSLYFLFAFWGGFIRKSLEDKESVEENINLSEILFSDEIQAWVYGPVVPNVFQDKEIIKTVLTKEEIGKMFKDKSVLKDAIDGLLDDIFKISDFKLVSISHEDKCWKDNFILAEEVHHREIPKECILLEYALK